MEVGSSLGSYEIRGMLGAGGMGEVYRALDTKLQRHVALKVVPLEMAADPQVMARLQREARLLAAISHPNIATIYGIEEHGGRPLLVLELVEGESLAKRLGRGPLPWKEAVRAARQIADAMEAAHEKGIIHRDLKPSNIVLGPKGIVKILDFGLAKPRDQAAPDELQTIGGDSDLTDAGTLLGTFPYMSPEQVRTEVVDHRTDIWAFGCVLYEMLAGKAAFGRETAADTISAIVSQEPDKTLLPERVPPAVRMLLSRCLQKDRTRRLQDLADARVMLEEALYPSLDSSERQVVFDKPEPSVAVLPFTNMSTDPDNEYFSDGLAEELIHALGKLGGIQVAARTSSFQFKNKAQDVREIGRHLGVGAVLEGSVRKAGSKVRVTVDLIDVADGYHLWTNRFDRELKDVFAIQEEIAGAIVQELEVKLTARPEEPLVKHYTEDLEAYTLYMKGRYYWEQRYSGGLERSIEFFRKAIEVDPGHALAHAGLADAYWSLGLYQIQPPKEVFPLATRSAKRALEIDDDLAEAHATLAVVRYLFEWDWAGAEDEFLRAIELNPHYSIAHGYFAMMLATLGRQEEALTHARSAQDLDPFSDYARSLRAFTLSLLGHDDEAIAVGEEALELDPDSFLASWTLGWSYDRAGRYEDAIELYSRILELRGRVPSILALMGHALGKAGRHETARELLDELREGGSSDYVSPVFVGWIHQGLGETAAAVEEMDRAFENRCHPINFVMFGPFRDHLARMGLSAPPE